MPRRRSGGEDGRAGECQTSAANPHVAHRMHSTCAYPENQMRCQRWRKGFLAMIDGRAPLSMHSPPSHRAIYYRCRCSSDCSGDIHNMTATMQDNSPSLLGFHFRISRKFQSRRDSKINQKSIHLMPSRERQAMSKRWGEHGGVESMHGI